MSFNFNFPVRVFSGYGCVKANKEYFRLGKHAFIVCGRNGAKASGALDDVTDVLAELGIGVTLFNEIRENPPLETCFEGGKRCNGVGADFVIGIGGGSALDASKAVALFATNPDSDKMDVFDASKEKNKPLPLIAIPTTSGTGSEANGTSVMSLPDGKQKKSFASEWPRYSFLDPTYTASLSPESTISCALDAFAHAFESYLSPKSSDMSRMLALYAAKQIIPFLKNGGKDADESTREALQNAACAAGMAISVSGTGAPHPLGYSLTMLDGVPHGSACAVFYKYFIEYNMKTELGKKLVEEFCASIGTTPSVLSELIPSLSGVTLRFDESEINERVSLIAGAKNYVNSPYVLSDEEKIRIYKELFLK